LACDKFVIDRYEIDSPTTLGGDDRFHILQPIQGELRFEAAESSGPLHLGDTALLPAGLGKTCIVPTEKSEFLDIYLP
jgi:mannose-6-phosphate isomerase class I